MYWHAYQLLASVVAGLYGRAAIPFQEGEFLGIPLWGWLLAGLALFLLLAFVVIVILDWRSAEEAGDSETE